MARFLFVVPPLVGHVNPAVGVAAELTARGHEVAWAGHDELLWQLAGPAALVFSCAVPPDLPPRPAGLKGPAALRFLWEDFLVPLGDAMAPGVAAALDAFQPHVVVADQQALAGGLLADAGGLPWVTSATTSAELVDPLSGMPKVADWVDGLLAGLRTRIAGGRGEADPRFSPHGVLAFTTRELLGAAELPPRIRLVGPALGPRPSTTDFPWAWLDPLRPTVLVSLGTANTGAGTEFLAATAEAFAGLPARAVIADPGGVLGDVPPNVLVRSRVPQLPLLARVDAVLCHAGHNTVCETLWHGLPLVVAPIRDDQPIVAAQVVAAGAGVRLRFGRADAPRIAAAVEEVLTEPGYRRAAETVAASFRAAGGSAAAAGYLEQLALENLAHLSP
ncbi:glycosyl transferase [Amycolatopsis balhimycina DSM 5908]|uniref:Glycosyl transferase n=1 Tax=Amycolatopsis balhimycina DSM 5908 TaxID=1081091 RepID=A0A428WN46_AMYBA|nr:nucleotide disphospho-sugar-binding domain-containing protein [Amycolatopsis balhimycina]RSM44448.1 glycosyl transferase [Amycolatopsis balhimycina DSM 5908]